MLVSSTVKTMLAVGLALFAAALVASLPAGDAKDGPAQPLSERSPFLDALFAPKPAVVTKPVEWVSAFGEQQGWLVREKTNERLPALLLIASPRENEFFQQSAHELASIGFAVLLVEIGGKQKGLIPGSAPTKQKMRSVSSESCRNCVRPCAGCGGAKMCCPTRSASLAGDERHTWRWKLPPRRVCRPPF